MTLAIFIVSAAVLAIRLNWREAMLLDGALFGLIAARTIAEYF